MDPSRIFQSLCPNIYRRYLLPKFSESRRNCPISQSIQATHTEKTTPQLYSAVMLSRLASLQHIKLPTHQFLKQLLRVTRNDRGRSPYAKSNTLDEEVFRSSGGFQGNRIRQGQCREFFTQVLMRVSPRKLGN